MSHSSLVHPAAAAACLLQTCKPDDCWLAVAVETMQHMNLSTVGPQHQGMYCCWSGKGDDAMPAADLLIEASPVPAAECSGH
jgi:hypothetical protein